MRVREVIAELRRLAESAFARGLARFGLPTDKALGVAAPQLRSLARRIGGNQGLSLELWKTEILEARVLAALIGEPKKVTKRQMDRWARDFDSWGVCDACCAALFVESAHAVEMAMKWQAGRAEFVKRAGFVLMASLAIHRKDLDDCEFIPILRAIKKQAGDERMFVRKAVNWALRQIGKRNQKLNKLAIEVALQIKALDSPAARWIASDALRELRSEAVQCRLRRKLVSARIH